MDRISVVAVLLVVLVAAQGSEDSFLRRSRNMAEGKPPVVDGSPSPEPITETKSNSSNSNNSTLDKSGDQNPPVLETNSTLNKSGVQNPPLLDKLNPGKPALLPNPSVPNNSEKSDPKGNVEFPEGQTTGHNVKKGLNKEVMNEKCKESWTSCTVQEKLVACLQHSQNGSQESFILIQNEGETSVKVDVTVPDSVATTQLEIPKHQAKKINVPINVGESPKILVKAEHGSSCVLHVGVPISEGSFFKRIPSYANMMTPIYGAYLIVVFAVLVGGTWACCKFVKKRRHGNGGVAYQELEMGLPESTSAAATAETADGWDEGWDDDWDEEAAVRSPGHRVGNVSANGLTSRTPKKDGWETDWDD